MSVKHLYTESEDVRRILQIIWDWSHTFFKQLHEFRELNIGIWEEHSVLLNTESSPRGQDRFLRCQS